MDDRATTRSLAISHAHFLFFLALVGLGDNLRLHLHIVMRFILFEIVELAHSIRLLLRQLRIAPVGDICTAHSLVDSLRAPRRVVLIDIRLHQVLLEVAVGEASVLIVTTHFYDLN